MTILNLDIASLVLLLIMAFAVLAVVQIALAVRHDHEISLSGPREQLSQVQARLAAAQDNLKDVEEDLRQRREALARVADIQAEVDALIRQREDLLQEWGQLEERREEVRSMRLETEQTHQSLQEATRDLSEKQDALDQVQERLDRADRLIGRLDELQNDEQRLARRLESLRTEQADLLEAKDKAERLRVEVEDLERESASLAVQNQATQTDLDRLKEETSAANQALAQSKTTHVEQAARLAARAEEVARLDENVRTLEARYAQLEKATTGPGTGDAVVDPLKELKEPPEVLRQLSKWAEWHPVGEAEALQLASNRMKKVGLDYSTRVVRAFHTAMKVNQTTQMAVLAGISGTGKSQLPRQYAAGMGIGFLQVPVQPRWDSPQDLMGFYNYIEGRFRPTDMARALYHLDGFNGPEQSQELQDRMLLILLDEMNLARVEYYFSDFLSRLESRPRADQVSDDQLRKDAEIELEIPMPGGKTSPRVFPGYNLLFAGTMNEDESTQSLSDKVVDRANVLRFTAPKRIGVMANAETLPQPQALSKLSWSRWGRSPGQIVSGKDRVEGYVDTLIGLMRELQRPFGHRLGIAMMAYVANYPEVDGGFDPRIPMADQVEMRLLPKLRGLDVDVFDREIKSLADFVAKDLNDSTLAEAIEESLEVAQGGTGTFLWRGVSRA